MFTKIFNRKFFVLFLLFFLSLFISTNVNAVTTLGLDISTGGSLTVVGNASLGTVNGNTITTGTGILTIGAGKTLTISNTLTLAGTDSSTLNIGAGGTLGTAAYTAATAYQTSSASLTSLAGLTYVSPSFIKMTAAGTFALDTNTYLTSSNAGTIFLAPNGSAASLTSFPTLNQNTTGSAATLTTARTINGVSFNGSANITIPSDIAPGVSGNVLTSNGIVWTSAAPASSGANALGTYIVQTATNAPANAQILASLGTGIVKNTTTTGVLSIAVAGDFPTLNQSTTGSAATLTTPRAIYGNNFDGSTALTGIIASTYGGTGNGFTKFSGPTTAEKTFTLPDANETFPAHGASGNVMTSNGTVWTSAAPGATILTAVKTADQTVVNSSTLQNDNHLTVTVEANTNYILEAVLLLQVQSVGSFQAQFSAPSGATLGAQEIRNTSGGSVFSSGNYISQLGSIFESGAVTYTAGTSYFRVEGTLFVSSTAGTFNLQWAQSVSNATGTILKKGSYLKLTKVQ